MNDEESHDIPRGRPSRSRAERTEDHRTGHPAFCIEMIDAVLMGSDYGHRVVTRSIADNDIPEEWIELEVPTDLYTNAKGDRRLAVTIRIEKAALRILAIEVYPRGSLRTPRVRHGEPCDSTPLLWFAHPRSGLAVELISEPLGRIDAIVGLSGVGAFVRTDILRFVRAFASAMDLVEQTIRDTGLRCLNEES